MTHRNFLPVTCVILVLFALPASLFAAASLDVTTGVLSYTGSGLANNLTVFISAGTYTFADTGETITLTANAVTAGWSGSGTNTVTGPSAGLTAISINSGSGTDTVKVVDSSAIPISIDTAIGVPDSTILGDGTTGGLLGTVSVTDTGGVGSLTIDDSADITSRTVGIDATQISGATPNPVAYLAGITAVTVETGPGSDSFTLSAASVDLQSVNLLGGTGSDAFNVTALPNVGTTVTGGDPTPPTSPGDTLNVDFNGGSNPSLSVSSGASGFSGSWTFSDRGTITFSEIETFLPRVASQIVVVSGTPQTAFVGTAFGDPLVVRVLDEFDQPVPDVLVTFTPPGSGASALLSPSLATDSNGETQTTAIANDTVGSYQVVATTAGAAGSAIFDLTNALPKVPTLGGVGLAALALLLGLGALLVLRRGGGF